MRQFWIAPVFFFFTVSQADGTELSALLDRCAQIEQMLQHASIKGNATASYVDYETDNDRRGKTRIMVCEHEIVSDGNRFAIDRTLSFSVSPQAEPYETLERRCLYDGQQSYIYGRAMQEGKQFGPGLSIEQDAQIAQTMFNFNGMEDGFWRGSVRSDTKDIVTILRENASTIQFDPSKIETVNSVPCYRLDLTSAEGQRTIWIAQEESASIVRAEVTYRKGDLYNGRELADENVRRYIYDVSSFLEQEGFRIPGKVTLVFQKESPSGAKLYEETSEITCQSLDLHPEYEKCFALDFPDGTPVRLRGKTDTGVLDLIWDANKRCATAALDDRFKASVATAVETYSSGNPKAATPTVAIEESGAQVPSAAEGKSGRTSRLFLALCLAGAGVVALTIFVFVSRRKPNSDT